MMASRILIILFTLAYLSPKAQISSGATSVKTILDFSLKDVSSQHYSTKNKKVKGYIVIFTCNHCPFAKLYTQRLNELYSKYNSLGVPLIAINSMDTILYEDESFLFMRERAEKDGFLFPYLQDEFQEIGKMFGATRTPQAYILWKEKEKWLIKYSGAIDNNGEHPEMATSYVANALDNLLVGSAVNQETTSSLGCKILYRQ